jgi:WD40 repeat protein
LVASFIVPPTGSDQGTDVIVDPKSEDLYLIDYGVGALGRANWKTKEQWVIKDQWATLDSAGCSGYSPRLYAVRLMKKVPYLIVSDCQGVKLLDKATFAVVRTIFAEKEFTVFALAFSPDERFLAVTVKKGRDEPLTRLYETDTWKLIHEWSFAASSFTPDGRLLVTSFSRKRSPSSITLDESGFQFYDAMSGNKVSEWLPSIGEDAGIFPALPVFFRPDQPGRMITIDHGHTAVAEWDEASGKLLQHLKSKVEVPGPPPGPSSRSLSYDGRLFAVVWWEHEWPSRFPEFGTTIWDLSKGKAVYDTPVRQQADPVRRVVFSGDDNHVAFVYAHRAELYEYQLK